MPYTPRKKVHRTLEGVVTDVKNETKKTSPRKIEETVFLSMVYHRDMLWLSQGKHIEELTSRHSIPEIEADRLRYKFMPELRETLKFKYETI